MFANRSTRLVAVICYVASSAILGVSVCWADNPNVVVFFVDDMGWTDWQHDATLNSAGSPVYETPNLIRLAQSGQVFDRAYASAPVCSPTRASLLSGKSSARTGVSDFLGGGSNKSATLQSPVWTQGLPSSEVTIAESLGSAAGGYDTGYIGKWHAGSGPTSHGFDYNIAGGGAGCPCDGEGGFFAGPDGRWSGMPGIDTPGTYPADTYLTDVLAGFAEDYIEQRANGINPFFLMMAPYQVHVPLQAPAALVNKYQTKITDLTNQGVDLHGHDNATYAAMVEKMDEALGRVLDRLEDPDGDPNTADSIRDDTIVIFASDNGGLTVGELGYPPATNNVPLREGKGSLYEGGIRTPFVVSWTGNANVSQGTVNNARVSTHDLYPTLLEVSGLESNASVPRNENIDGVSFTAALEGGPHDRGYQYWHYPHQSNQHKVSGGAIQGGSFMSAVRDDQYKLIYFYETGTYELYDLAADMGETVDVIAADPNEAFSLSAQLHSYLKRVGASMPVLRATGTPVDLPPVLWLTLQGDFNGSGTIDVADWLQLKSVFFSNFSHLDAIEAYTMGDMNLDGYVDRFDFSDFKAAYEAENGIGSFDALLAGVPEPSTVLLMTIGVAWATLKRCRMKRSAS